MLTAIHSHFIPSIMSSTITVQNLAERTAHSYTGSLYLLPSDEEERQR